jgi:hypothetical protein
MWRPLHDINIKNILWVSLSKGLNNGRVYKIVVKCNPNHNQLLKYKNLWYLLWNSIEEPFLESLPVHVYNKFSENLGNMWFHSWKGENVSTFLI